MTNSRFAVIALPAIALFLASGAIADPAAKLEKKVTSRNVDISGYLRGADPGFDGEISGVLTQIPFASSSGGGPLQGLRGIFGGQKKAASTGRMATVSARINRKQAKMIVDTGSQVTVLDSKVANAAKVPVGTDARGKPYTFQAIGPYGSEDFFYGNVQELQLSKFAASNFLCGIRLPQAASNPSWNILGLDVLKECAYVTIDWPARRVTLSPQQAFPGSSQGGHASLPMIRSSSWASKPAIFVRLSLPGGKSVTALLDTGTSDALQLPRSVINQLPQNSVSLLGRQISNQGIGGSSTFSIATISEVGLGNWRAGPVQAAISESSRAVVGCGLFQSAQLTLDFRRNLVWVR